MRRILLALAIAATALALPRIAFTASDEETVRQLKRDVARGDANAQVRLGYFYEMGRGGLPKDDREAARLYKLSADQGNAAARNNLGLFYRDGRGGLAKDEREAARLFRLGTDQGNAYAQDNLGIFYQNGRGGLAKDEREAVRLYRLSADQSNADGRVNLGYCYEKGIGGLTKDEREAARLYKLASDQGNVFGQANLGVFYRDARGGLTKDEREAARLFKLAADQGNSGARTSLGYFYERGLGGLTKDDNEAVRLYKLASDQGNSTAENNLGVLYRDGRGGLAQDDREAVRLFRLAADQNNAYGQMNLGVFYRDGRGGLTKDDHEAARLLKLAADQGNANAKTALSQLGPLVEANAAPDVARSPVSPAPSPAPANVSIAERRVALIIGNSAYQAVSRLPNTVNDANAVAETLKSDGFAVVRTALDATRSGIIAALNDFQREADAADWAVVYYAGHGLEMSGTNYLVPVDARLADDRSVQDEALSMDRILSAVENARKLRLVILDACRDNPFLKTMHRSIATRSISRGLAAVEPTGATLIVFAAKDGETAGDGDGDHSPFTASLIKRLQQPSLEINKLFRLVTADVLKATGNQQRPFAYGSLPGEEDYYFRLK